MTTRKGSVWRLRTQSKAIGKKDMPKWGVTIFNCKVTVKRGYLVNEVSPRKRPTHWGTI
jgi:hypothetical protein